MEIFEIKEVPERGIVAPPMVVAVAVKKGDKSTFAVKWALDQLMSAGQTLILLHVRPRLLTIPTQMGNHVPISQVQGDAVAAYMQVKTKALFSPYRRLCNAKKVKTMFTVVEEDGVASAIIKQISNYGIGILVMGSSSSNALIRRFKGFDIPATVAKNAPNFCTVYTISKNKSISVRKATCTESKIGNPEDSSHHSNGFSDTNNFSFPRTGGTVSETETSNQYYSQRLPFRRNESPSNINQVMRSRSVLNSATTISNVENLKSGSISVSQTSTVAAVHGSGPGRSSISRSEGYNECNSTMSIDEREYPNNSTEVPWTSAPSPGDLPPMESDTYSVVYNAISIFWKLFRWDFPVKIWQQFIGIANLIVNFYTIKATQKFFKGVLPELERFKALAVALTRQVKREIDVTPPNHFTCPILQEVMDDPHVAADGFTYEHNIIKSWLENKNTSPMTNLPLTHKYLLPNHSLRSAILDWKVKSGFNQSDL